LQRRISRALADKPLPGWADLSWNFGIELARKKKFAESLIPAVFWE
jgi:hypothetical protein